MPELVVVVVATLVPVPGSVVAPGIVVGLIVVGLVVLGLVVIGLIVAIVVARVFVLFATGTQFGGVPVKPSAHRREPTGGMLVGLLSVTVVGTPPLKGLLPKVLLPNTLPIAGPLLEPLKSCCAR